MAGDALSFLLSHGTSTSSPTSLPTSFPLRQQNILQHDARTGDIYAGCDQLTWAYLRDCQSDFYIFTTATHNLIWLQSSVGLANRCRESLTGRFKEVHPLFFK